MADLAESGLKSLYLQALALPPEEREPWLKALPADQQALVVQVRQLLDPEATTDFSAAGEQIARVAHAAMAPAPSVPGFKMLERIGEGGMGVVWKAVQLKTKREVAVKVLLASQSASTKAAARFDREIELAASLDHPYIARIFDGGVSNGVGYYAMELISGRPLGRTPGETDRDVVARVSAVAHAVGHAHERGVIHRDLKPGNIFISEAGTPKLLDFGLAAATARDDVGHDLTLSGDLVGTPAYMSPEQARGQGHLGDTRSDVYSLGVILFELLTGTRPHASTGSVLDVMRRVAEVEPTRPRSVRPDLDSELEAILVKALARDPAARYGTANALADDLDRYLAGEPLQARPATTWYFLRKRLYRHRWALSAAAIGLVAALTLGVIYVRTIQAERDKAETSRLIADKNFKLADSQLHDSVEQRVVALRALDDLVFSVQRELKNDSFSVAMRRKLLETALQGVRRVTAVNTQANIGTERTEAFALIELATLDAQSGDAATADAGFSQGLRLLDAAYRQAPDDPVRLRDLINARGRYGRLLLQSSKPAVEPTDFIRQTLDLLYTPPAQGGHFNRERRSLLLLLGDALKQSNVDPLPTYREALNVGPRDHPDWVAAATRVANVVASSDTPADELTAALAVQQTAVDVARKLSDANGKTVSSGQSLSAALIGLSNLQRKMQDLPAAEESASESLAIANDLLSRFPDQPDLIFDAAAVTFTLGTVRAASDRPAAEPLFDKAAAILKSRPTILATDRRWQTLAAAIEKKKREP